MIEWLMALVMAGIVALWLYQNGKDGKYRGRMPVLYPLPGRRRKRRNVWICW